MNRSIALCLAMLCAPARGDGTMLPINCSNCAETLGPPSCEAMHCPAPTVRWLNDEAKAKHDECEAKRAKDAAYQKAHPPKPGDAWVYANMDYFGPCPSASWFDGPLPSGERVEFGLRSDGVVVWREDQRK